MMGMNVYLFIGSFGVVGLGLGLLMVLTIGRPRPYSDGFCYLCRKGQCGSGDNCSECGTYQP